MYNHPNMFTACVTNCYPPPPLMTKTNKKLSTTHIKFDCCVSDIFGKWYKDFRGISITRTSVMHLCKREIKVDNHTETSIRVNMFRE